MIEPGAIYVWRIPLDGLREEALAPAAEDEVARAARFASELTAAHYLRSHRALRTILGALTSVPLEFAVASRGKPYLPAAPELRFNLARSHGMAVAAAALHVEVGVDVERLRPMPDREAIVDRFFPPAEAAAYYDVPPPARERAFFSGWTRVEAVLKARGVGLYGAGEDAPGPWTIQEIEAGPDFAAAVAAPQKEMRVRVRDFAGGPVPSRRMRR